MTIREILLKQAQSMLDTNKQGKESLDDLAELLVGEIDAFDTFTFSNIDTGIEYHVASNSGKFSVTSSSGELLNINVQDVTLDTIIPSTGMTVSSIIDNMNETFHTNQLIQDLCDLFSTKDEVDITEVHNVLSDYSPLCPKGVKSFKTAIQLFSSKLHGIDMVNIIEMMNSSISLDDEGNIDMYDHVPVIPSYASAIRKVLVDSVFSLATTIVSIAGGVAGAAISGLLNAGKNLLTASKNSEGYKINMSANSNYNCAFRAFTDMGVSDATQHGCVAMRLGPLDIFYSATSLAQKVNVLPRCDYNRGESTIGLFMKLKVADDIIEATDNRYIYDNWSTIYEDYGDERYDDYNSYTSLSDAEYDLRFFRALATYCSGLLSANCSYSEMMATIANKNDAEVLNDLRNYYSSNQLYGKAVDRIIALFIRSMSYNAEETVSFSEALGANRDDLLNFVRNILMPGTVNLVGGVGYYYFSRIDYMVKDFMFYDNKKPDQYDYNPANILYQFSGFPTTTCIEFPANNAGFTGAALIATAITASVAIAGTIAVAIGKKKISYRINKKQTDQLVDAENKLNQYKWARSSGAFSNQELDAMYADYNKSANKYNLLSRFTGRPMIDKVTGQTISSTKINSESEIVNSILKVLR